MLPLLDTNCSFLLELGHLTRTTAVRLMPVSATIDSIHNSKQHLLIFALLNNGQGGSENGRKKIARQIFALDQGDDAEVGAHLELSGRSTTS